MGTLFRLVFYAPDAPRAQAAATAAFARVAELNRIMSDYDPDSEVCRLVRHPPGTALALSSDLFAVLQQSQQLAAESRGAFDVTLGPLVRLWRESRRTRTLPAPADLATARRASGHEKLRLQPDDRTATLLAPGMQIDLGGIAKGYAADEALAVLTRLGFPHAMVAASGDLAVGDAPPQALGWKIEIAPGGPASRTPLVLLAANVGVSTSGDAEQFAEIGGVRYAHIVDPATGLGLPTAVAVTVVAPRATLADSLATACCVLAVTGRAELSGCLGNSARAFVFRRDAEGGLQRESYGSDPAGLRSSL